MNSILIFANMSPGQDYQPECASELCTQGLTFIVEFYAMCMCQTSWDVVFVWSVSYKIEVHDFPVVSLNYLLRAVSAFGIINPGDKRTQTLPENTHNN